MWNLKNFTCYPYTLSQETTGGCGAPKLEEKNPKKQEDMWPWHQDIPHRWEKNPQYDDEGGSQGDQGPGGGPGESSVRTGSGGQEAPERLSLRSKRKWKEEKFALLVMVEHQFIIGTWKTKQIKTKLFL